MFLTGYSVVNVDCSRQGSGYACVSKDQINGRKVYTSEIDEASRTITYFTCKNAKNKQDKYCLASGGGI